MDTSQQAVPLGFINEQRLKRGQVISSHARSNTADAVAVDKKGKRSEDDSTSSLIYYATDAEDAVAVDNKGKRSEDDSTSALIYYSTDAEDADLQSS